MQELIDRQAALKKMCESCGYCERFEKAMRTTHPDFVSDKCNNYKFLAEQPAIESQIRHGRWIELPKALNPDENPCKCSACGHCLSFYNHYQKSKFCPNCGADMREVIEDATD